MQNLRRTAVIEAPEDTDQLGTVLGIWAHPDDEAYLSAGLMALAAKNGNDVVCVTATKGEHGTPDADRYPPAAMAKIREREMAAALAAVGVSDGRWLGYEDGALEFADTDTGIAAVQSHIEQVRPDTIVTFGPDGMTGHPDHCVISNWATSAWVRSGAHGRLLYATTTAEFVDVNSDIHDVLPVFGEGLPLRTPAKQVALTVELDEWALDRKLEALFAHKSQTTQLIDLLGLDRYRTWWQSETFTAAA